MTTSTASPIIEAARMLWAWENPHPEQAITAVRFTPVDGKVVIGTISAGRTAEHPLRWRTRRKAVLTVPEGETADVHVDELGRSRLIQLDLRQAISLTPRREYPNEARGRRITTRCRPSPSAS